MLIGIFSYLPKKNLTSLKTPLLAFSLLVILQPAPLAYGFRDLWEKQKVKNTTDLSGLEHLPPDLLHLIAKHTGHPSDLDTLSVLSQTIHDKLYKDPTRLLRVMKTRRQLMPTVTPSAGGTYTQRVDLERHYSQFFVGPIWQAPDQPPVFLAQPDSPTELSAVEQPGLIWFPIELYQGQVVELAGKQAQKLCRKKGLEVGFDLRAPTVAEVVAHGAFLREFPTPLPDQAPFHLKWGGKPYWTLESRNGAPLAASACSPPAGGLAAVTPDHPLPVRCVHETQKQRETDLSKISEGILLAFLKAGHNYQEATSTGAIFTQRVDLEIKYRDFVYGEIWQEPNPKKNPKNESEIELGLQKKAKLDTESKGLIWFPTERINGKIAEFTFEEALERCREKSKELGLKVRPMTQAEAIRFREYFGAQPGSEEGYIPGVIYDIQFLWDPGNDYPTESLWAITDEEDPKPVIFNLEDGGVHTGPRAPKFRLRCVHAPEGIRSALVQ